MSVLHWGRIVHRWARRRTNIRKVALDPDPSSPEREAVPGPTASEATLRHMPQLADALFALSPQVRYVAILRGRDLSLTERPGLAAASASGTDRYEELLVNPAVLTLLQRRGEIDCGGLDHVWIRYGNFWTGLFPLPDGHLNVGLEPDAVPTALVERIRAELRRAGQPG